MKKPDWMFILEIAVAALVFFFIFGVCITHDEDRTQSISLAE